MAGGTEGDVIGCAEGSVSSLLIVLFFSGAVFCACPEWAKAKLRLNRTETGAHAAGRRLVSALYGVGCPAAMGLLWH